MKVPDPFRAVLPSRAPLQRLTGPPKRILVVDDDNSIRQLSTEMLVQAGFAVDAAIDGAAGWEALQAKQYDLMITDNSMPKVSGVELVKLLRSKNPILPIIMASGAAPTEEMRRNPWLDISVILLKPYTLDQLLDTVRQVLCAAPDDRETLTPPAKRRSSLP
jgi:DNA-binding response OmpR family regulator